MIFHNLEDVGNPLILHNKNNYAQTVNLYDISIIFGPMIVLIFISFLSYYLLCGVTNLRDLRDKRCSLGLMDI